MLHQTVKSMLGSCSMSPPLPGTTLSAFVHQSLHCSWTKAAITLGEERNLRYSYSQYSHWMGIKVGATPPANRSRCNQPVFVRATKCNKPKHIFTHLCFPHMSRFFNHHYLKGRYCGKQKRALGWIRMMMAALLCC